ncbi:hypothetical protein Bca101_025656 [Brassica carinata]
MEMTEKEPWRREDTMEKASPESSKLPPNIIIEILIRLPAKSIGRFRSMKPVCSSKNGRRRNMMLYNFETDASRYLRIRGVNLSDGFEADTYVESFISPNSYGAEN